MTISLKNVGSGFKRSALNENFTDIEVAINNEVLTRDGSTALAADLDLNSNRVTNVAAGVNPNDAATKAQVDAVPAEARGQLPSASTPSVRKGTAAMRRPTVLMANCLGQAAPRKGS